MDRAKSVRIASLVFLFVAGLVTLLGGLSIVAMLFAALYTIEAIEIIRPA